MDLKEMIEKRKAALLAARAIADAAEKAGRDFTTEERQQIGGHIKEAAELKKQIDAAEKNAADDAELKRQILELGEGLNEPQKSNGQHAGNGMAGRGKTIGERFVEAKAFMDWLKQFPNGRVPDSAKGLMSPPVEFKALFKDLLTGTSDTEAGAFVNTDVTGIYEPLGRRPRTLLDLIPRGTTQSDTVEFVRQTVAVSQAAPVAESNVTTYTGATGEVSGEKPEGSMAFEKVTAVVKTIAVWIPATKRALSDAGQLRSLIDQELREDCQEELEDQIYDGDNVGENFQGIVNTSGILTQAWDTDLLTTIRKARTAVTVTGKSRPNAIAMHPNDAETLDLLKDDQGRYYFGGPIAGGAQQVWRLPVVEAESVTEGTGLLGDFRKAKLWDREQATISVSDSHSDFFIRNMVAILCELRAAFGVIRPSAFCTVDLNAGS